MRRTGLGLLCFVLASILLLASQTTSASAATLTAHKSQAPLSCSNPLVIVMYNHGNSEWDDCYVGYQTPGLSNVTYVETLGNVKDHAWWKWYNGYTGRYCYAAGDYYHWSPPPGITNITQVDYGDPLPNPLPSGTYQQC